MYIKQVIIQGFKSYKDKTVIEPFDKRHNVVVGRNGSGKSNFFLAIEFALNDEYARLRDQQRQGLLYAGSGARAVSAYVEIIFDNSDSRIPVKYQSHIEQDELSLKRVIGLKKDQYYLNKKLVTRPEIVNLFESAGFSNCNPYYIINEMATAPDSYRLKLLCEVAGTRVYDERRHESISTLREAQMKYKEVEEFLNHIDDKLHALEEQTEELKQYQQFDKMHRTLEYVAKAVKVERNTMNQLQEERDILTNELQSLIREKAKLELTIKDLPKEISNELKTKESAETQLAMELAMKEQRRTELYAKQDRVSMFASKQDRDKWIQEQLEIIEKQLKDKQHHREQLEEDLAKDAKKEVALQRKIEDHELDRQKKLIDEYKESIHEMKKNKNELQTKRRVNRAILNGMDSVRKVMETFASRGGQEEQVISHYHGLFADNFDCHKSIYTAVEVTAGNRLFYHIVDTDIVANAILKEMNRQSLPGEVNFFPLNRLDVREHRYPQSADAVPIIDQLRYDKKCDKAMRFVLGKTMICRDLEVATNVARTAGLDCVTLDGDKAESKGVLTGGYHNPSRSRLETYKNRKDIFDQYQQCRQELERIKVDILETQTSIAGIDSEIHKTESKMNEAKVKYEKVNAELRFLREELTNIKTIRGPKEVSLAKCKLELEAIQNSMELLEAELHQDILSQLTEDEQQQLEILNSDIQRLQSENKEVVTARIKLEAEKNKLENLLSNNLIRKKGEILNMLQEIDLEDKRHQLANAKADLEEVDLKIDKINQELTTIQQNVKDTANRLKKEETELENMKKQERDAKEEIEEGLRNLEKLSTKQTQLEQKIAESTEKINQFGTLPAQELYTQIGKSQQQYEKVCSCKQEGFRSIFTLNEDRKKLQKRKEDCSASYQKIEELLATLDQRKMEAIFFTFKQCSKYFTEVFKKLVSKGTAKLVLRQADRSEGDQMGSEKNLDNLTGIGIKVSFTGSDATMKQLDQLSGGQKSIVALALIFAIQKCDPAPFYLFDEIDQALDREHREAVANMIHELSNEAQFITTTFRPELLEHANKFYGVKFRNKVSYIECVSKEEVKDFVEDDRTYS
nr:unnamed protein product [Callosobruchus analis]